MLKKTSISIEDVLFGDVLTDRPGDVLAIHPGTFWFGDVLSGHRRHDIPVHREFADHQAEAEVSDQYWPAQILGTGNPAV